MNLANMIVVIDQEPRIKQHIFYTCQMAALDNKIRIFSSETKKIDQDIKTNLLLLVLLNTGKY